eukprot:GHVS01041878.1.p1 GENE.GHVS01041878.1~~GHVS01041878.1.p1  ORF type:complete len:191 (+),score=32.02 GHVS01041878.1:408-980(+)
MVSQPSLWLEPFAKSGASQLTFHWECMESENKQKEQEEQKEDVEKQTSEDNSSVLLKIKQLKAIELGKQIIDKHKIKAGISIKPQTPLVDLIPVLQTGYFSTLLVMTVEPGFGGQTFMSETMPKVKMARSKFPLLNIQVDGGLTEDTAECAASWGANVIVAGTTIMGAEDIPLCIANLRKAVDKNIDRSP